MLMGSATFSVVLLALASALTTSATYTWPNYVMDELEHLLVDNGGFNDAGVLKAITPCTNYVSGPQTAGRVTAAEWTRVLFHDFVTANVSAGTGGLDASLSFEYNRPENSGLYINNSMAFFSPYVNQYVSMADLTALSLTVVSRACSNPPLNLALRGGRIDATEAGPYGVPQPETDIQDTLQSFAGAGFSPKDTIALTACAHTLGNVHYSENPDIVPASAVTPDDTAGGVHFDTTPSMLDQRIVREYLNTTGQRGGPLVTSSNITVRSDLRLYSSDNNATVKHLAGSPSNFVSMCSSVINRAMDTVPATVTFTDVITPLEVKPVGVSVKVDSTGGLVFSGYIRLLSTTWSKNSSVTVSWTPRSGSPIGFGSTLAVLAETGSGIYGTTYYHSFSTPVDPTLGISSFAVLVNDGSTVVRYGNGGSDYPMSDTVLFMPAETSVLPTGVAVSAAVLTSTSPTNVSAVLAIPSPQEGSLSPKITTSTIPLTQNGTRGYYTVYTGFANVSNLMNVNQTSVNILAVTSTNAIARSEFNKLS